MNAQEIFDTVFTKLYEQGKQSVDPELPHTCMYRGPDGMKCAAGFLIPDELYRPEMENISIGGHGPIDGCMVVLPGIHFSTITLVFRSSFPKTSS